MNQSDLTWMRLQDTIRPLLIAPLGSVVVHAILMFGFQGQRPSVELLFIVLAIVCGVSLAASIVLVVPVLVLVPRLRQPATWFATAWGALTGSVAATAIFGPSVLAASSRFAIVGFAAAGGASELLYAIAARRVRPSIR
jgi:hypothetical protein